MRAEEAYGAAKSYVDETLKGVGAIAGKPCQIKSITDITGGHRITFSWVDNSSVEHTQTLDVMDGEKGDKGDKGDKGNTGDVGATGPRGQNGTAATVRVGAVTSGVSPSVTNSGTAQDAIFDFILPKGDKGDKGDKGEDGQNGSSFSIRSRFATYEELVAAFPDGPEHEGDAYFVGTTASPDLYIWLVEESEWHNNGPIAGVKGDKGDQGDEGFSPIANVTKNEGISTITIRDKVGTTTAQVKDGYSPSVDVSKEGEVITVEVTDESGTTEQVLDFSGKINKNELGTAAYENVTDYVSPGNNGIPKSSSVYNAITSAAYGAYHPSGSKTIAELTSDLLVLANIGNVYKITEDGVTTDLFIGGAGQTIHTGDNAVVVYSGTPNTFLFDLQSGSIDLTPYQTKALESAVEGETTVEGALGALSTKKASKVSSATNGNFAGLDASGNLTDSGSKASDFASSAIMDGATINSFGDVETALAGKANATDVASDIRDVYSVMGKNGAKNLITIQRAGYTGSYNGISYVFNNDGSVTLNGTATANAYIYLWALNTWANEKFKAGSYIASASLDKASETKVWFGADKRDASSYIVQYFNIGVDSTTPVERTFESDGEYYISYWVNVRNGNTVDNVTIYPMLRLAEDTDNTYVPYAKTNRELTDVIPSDASASNKLVTESDFTSYGIKTIWTGSKTKGDTGMNFDASPYDLCFAQVGGTWCRLTTGVGGGSTTRKKFSALYAGRDYVNADTYEQYYLLDIAPDGTIATCGWFDIDAKDTQNARLAGQKALELAIAGTSTWTDPTWRKLSDVETNVSVSKIIGIKFQTKS